MPFEFIGEAPALGELSNPVTPFSSFGSVVVSREAGSDGNFKDVDGDNVSVEGTSLQAPLSAEDLNARMLQKEKDALATAKDSVLTRALSRALHDRLAVFGHVDKAADSVLADFVSSPGTNSEQRLTILAQFSCEVRMTANFNPTVTRFIEFLMAEATQTRLPPPILFQSDSCRRTPTAPRSGSSRPASLPTAFYPTSSPHWLVPMSVETVTQEITWLWLLSIWWVQGRTSIICNNSSSFLSVAIRQALSVQHWPSGSSNLQKNSSRKPLAMLRRRTDHPQ